jgi:hypothetical protein
MGRISAMDVNKDDVNVQFAAWMQKPFLSG